MSSAILYLAIVAIWACVLVPRWLHRSHDNHSEQEGVYESAELSEYAEYSESAEFTEFAEGGDPDQVVVEGEPGVAVDPVAWENPGAAPVSSGSADPAGASAEDQVRDQVGEHETAVHAEYSSVSYSRTTFSVETAGAGDLDGTADLAGGAGGDAYVAASARFDYTADYAAGYSAEYDAGAEYVPPAEYVPAAEYDAGADPEAVPPGDAPQDWSAEHTGPGRQQPHGPSRPPGRPASRAHVLQSRRRLLTMLVALTIGTALCTITGLMPWWVLIVPIGLVGLYLMLLREVALADAENARRRAEAHARHVRAARAKAMHERAAREAAAVAAAEQTAQVIDLTALAAQYARDQPYDQYADDKIRAVGD